MPSETGGRALTAVLVALVVVLAIAVVVLISGETGSDTAAPAGGDPSLVLDAALADGLPAYVLVRSAT